KLKSTTTETRTKKNLRQKRQMAGKLRHVLTRGRNILLYFSRSLRGDQKAFLRGSTDGYPHEIEEERPGRILAGTDLLSEHNSQTCSETG
ncbi:hypothetical protein CEXT_290581, partial [Caerostris extrusa]